MINLIIFKQEGRNEHCITLNSIYLVNRAKAPLSKHIQIRKIIGSHSKRSKTDVMIVYSIVT